MEEGRLIWVQALRGAAAAMVVCHHYVAAQAERGEPVGGWLLEFGGSGVDIFFVISGFIMTLTASGASGNASAAAAGRFLVRRLVRIAPLYWALTALAFVLAAAFPTHAQPDAQKLALSLLFLPEGGPGRDMGSAAHTAYVIPMAWTLTYEWLFYLVFALALALGLGPRARLWFIGTVFAGCLAAGQVARPLPPLAQMVASPLLLEFLLGCAVAALRAGGLRLSGMQAALLALWAGWLLSNIYHDTAIERVLLWGAAAFMLVLSAALCDGGDGNGRTVRPLARLGDISYALYLSHFFTIALFVRMQRHLAVLDDGFGPLAIAAFALLALYVAELCYRWIEDPARRMLAQSRLALRKGGDAS